MAGDYGLEAMTGVIPTIMVAGVATNMVDRMGLGPKSPRVAQRRKPAGRPTNKSNKVAGYHTRSPRNVNDAIFGRSNLHGMF